MASVLTSQGDSARDRSPSCSLIWSQPPFCSPLARSVTPHPAATHRGARPACGSARRRQRFRAAEGDAIPATAARIGGQAGRRQTGAGSSSALSHFGQPARIALAGCQWPGCPSRGCSELRISGRAPTACPQGGGCGIRAAAAGFRAAAGRGRAMGRTAAQRREGQARAASDLRRSSPRPCRRRRRVAAVRGAVPVGSSLRASKGRDSRLRPAPRLRSGPKIKLTIIIIGPLNAR